MKICFVGDVVGEAGRRIAAEYLPKIKYEKGYDYLVINAENSAGGLGITPRVVEELLKLGASCLTGGNHTWDKRDGLPLLDNNPRILRPHNYPQWEEPHRAPGSGVFVDDFLGMKIAIINLQGRSFMEPIDCPFQAAKQILKTPAVAAAKIRLVDFHAETTSEKSAMGWFLDGKVSAVLGTHTHVPTADTRILPKGTGFQCDVGMTGSTDSILGVDVDIILQRFVTKRPVKFTWAEGRPRLRGVLLDIDESTGKCLSLERLDYGTEV